MDRAIIAKTLHSLKLCMLLSGPMATPVGQGLENEVECGTRTGNIAAARDWHQHAAHNSGVAG